MALSGLKAFPAKRKASKAQRFGFEFSLMPEFVPLVDGERWSSIDVINCLYGTFGNQITLEFMLSM